jgi:hypothetical protein
MDGSSEDLHFINNSNIHAFFNSSRTIHTKRISQNEFLFWTKSAVTLWGKSISCYKIPSVGLLRATSLACVWLLCLALKKQMRFQNVK